ncbi:Uncharacterised protein [Burkholderia pseudomallei]|nr:Uncharacterised protein [Burkholderia pseudomallei]
MLTARAGARSNVTSRPQLRTVTGYAFASAAVATVATIAAAAIAAAANGSVNAARKAGAPRSAAVRFNIVRHPPDRSA